MEEKEKIIIENIGLIYKMMRKLNCGYTYEEREEYYFAGLIGLINASKTYDKEKSNTSYLLKSIQNSIIHTFIQRSAIKRQGKTISLNQEIGEEKELIDIIPDKYNLENEVIKKEQINQILNALNKLKNKQYKTFLKLYYGIGCKEQNICEISKKYGVSRQFVSKEIKTGIKKIKEVLNEKKNNEI